MGPGGTHLTQLSLISTRGPSDVVVGRCIRITPSRVVISCTARISNVQPFSLMSNGSGCHLVSQQDLLLQFRSLISTKYAFINRNLRGSFYMLGVGISPKRVGSAICLFRIPKGEWIILLFHTAYMKRYL